MSDEQVVTESPNIIDDTLPGGARWMHNLGDEPVWVETKTQLKAELAARGLVLAERDTYNKRDQSPWATRTRLRVSQTDPFLPKNVPPEPSPVTASPYPLCGPDGRPFGSTVRIDYQVASILRTYFSWVVRAGYEPELFCASCMTGERSAKSTFEVNEGDIEIECACRRIVYTGATRFARVAVTPFPALPTEDGVQLGPAHAILSQLEVETLRQWKTVLLQLGLKEALRCNACFQSNRADGVHAVVTSALVRIECRCRCYTYAGLTFA